MQQPTSIVFVVDDDSAVRNSLRLLLQSVGIASQPLGSAAEFLETYRPSQPGCLVLDVRMPGMSGLELLDALRRIAPALPVAVLTAHVQLGTAALIGRADEFLTKPVRIDELLATAAALIGRAAGRQEPATGQ